MPTITPEEESVKKLEDVLDPSSINLHDTLPTDCDMFSRNWNEWGKETGTGCISICFDKYGIDYGAQQLIGYGFDSICNTCDNHYSIVFMDPVEFPDVDYMNSGYDYILMLPLDGDKIKTGKDLCEYIMREVNDPAREAFTDHYSQYAIKNNTIYIFDNRSYYNNIGEGPGAEGEFFTYVFKICVKIEAEYNGPDPIRVGEQYDPNDVTVYGTWHDGTKSILRPDLYTFNNLDVTQFGPNEFIVTYVRNWDLKATFIVNGLLIIGIKAEYNGPDIWVKDEYDPEYVSVEALLLGDKTMPLNYTDCTFPDRIIIDNKYNWKECIYVDEYGDTWKCEFSVQGIPRPIMVIPTYIGPLKVMGDRVYKDEFKVQVKYLLNIFEEDSLQTEIVDITKDEWEFDGDETITEKNDGWFTIFFGADAGYAKLFLFNNCYVPYIGHNATLKAWYEGPPIQVGETYELPNVVIYICQPGKDRIRLLYNDSGVIMETDNVVRKEGANFYTVQYINRGINTKTKYIVPGIIFKQFPDGDFQVLYIVKGTFEEIDLTEEFIPYFTFQGNFVITWQQFLNRLIDYAKDGTPYFGMFRIVAPKRTGLFNKYASEWHVYCFDDFNLKAEIYKIYSDEIKEDDDNGQTEEESNPKYEYGGNESDGNDPSDGNASGGDSEGGSASTGSGSSPEVSDLPQLDNSVQKETDSGPQGCPERDANGR